MTSFWYKMMNSVINAELLVQLFVSWYKEYQYKAGFYSHTIALPSHACTPDQTGQLLLDSLYTDLAKFKILLNLFIVIFFFFYLGKSFTPHFLATSEALRRCFVH